MVDLAGDVKGTAYTLLLPDNNNNNNTNNTNNTTSYGGSPSSIDLFNIWYSGVHGYICMTVCIFGIISNIANIIVLTRKNMISSTNYLLTALASVDAVTMAVYMPYAVYFYIIKTTNPTEGHAQGWIVYLLVSTNLVITCHTIAMWLTVALAVFRYIMVCHHTMAPKLCNIQRAKITIISTLLAIVIFCIPNYIIHEVIHLKELNEREVMHIDGYWFKERAYATAHDRLLLTINFWLYGVVIKIIPCILLTLLSGLLIRAMQEASKKRARLMSQGMRAESERTNEHNRTTAMLVAVVLCFVITELPQGILCFMSGISQQFFADVYTPLGDVMDFLVLINSAVNFMLYCIMSRQFRDTFKDVFLSHCNFQRISKTPNGIHYSSITGETKV